VPPVIAVDLAASRRRIARLRRYVSAQLLAEGAFICPNFRECKRSRRSGDAFREGTMSHVGRHYDLHRDGRPLRIMVVGQESGWARVPAFRRRVTMEQRTEAVLQGSGLRRRYYADPAHLPRNPHMRGTTSALRLIFGKGLGADWDEEWVYPAKGRQFHIFDGFALVNRLLCSASPPKSRQGRPTRTMLTNCLEHFEATLAILEPTLIVLQGGLVARSVAAALPVTRQRSDYLYESTFTGNRALVCAFSHPSAQGVLRWGDTLTSPYLNNVVAPTLRRALRLL
jgi:hypothetical protein